MTFAFIAFAAGVLTVLAPCILPVLPIVIGGSAGDVRSYRKPLTIIASLSVSIIIFTLILKVSTALIDIDPLVWKSLSGGVLIIVGFVMFFPRMWERLSVHLGTGWGNKMLARGTQKKSMWGDVIVGAALGPVFSSCSPTYTVILATVLPESYAVGIFYLIMYVFGLASVLFLIVIFGQRVMTRLGSLADPDGWFKKLLGLLFIAVGIAIITGYDKIIESRILDTGIYDPIANIEGHLIEMQR